MPEDYPNKLLPVNTLFSHSLTAVNLECGWLLFEGVTTFQGRSTKIARDYRPCLKVNIGVLSCWFAPHLFSTLQSKSPTAFTWKTDSNLHLYKSKTSTRRRITAKRFLSVVFSLPRRWCVPTSSESTFFGSLRVFALLVLITANNSAYINTAGSCCGELKDKIISLGFLWMFTQQQTVVKMWSPGSFFMVFVAVEELKHFLPESSHNPATVYECKIYPLSCICSLNCTATNVFGTLAIEATHRNKCYFFPFSLEFSQNTRAPILPAPSNANNQCRIILWCNLYV